MDALSRTHMTMAQAAMGVTSSEQARTRFVDLLDAHRKIVLKVANTYARNAEDRADLAQESARILWLFGAIDHTAPVLAIQQQLARLRVGYLRSSFWLGNAWWIMWIPLLLVATVWENPFIPDDAWSNANHFAAINAAFGIAAVFAVAILMRLWRKRNPDSLHRFEDRSSRDIASALRELDELARFEKAEI
jgi:hypothetical protein